MALKSKDWFYKQCLSEIKQHGRFCHLCWDILQKGIGQIDSTRGHVTAGGARSCRGAMSARRQDREQLPFEVPNRIWSMPSPSSSITPDPVTVSASFASTGSDAHSGNCSKPSTASRPAAST